MEMKNGYSIYFTVCSQCNKKWLNKELSEKPTIQFNKQSIKFRGQGKKIMIKKISKMTPRKNEVNIYVI